MAKNSTIKWQTGTPKVFGKYLITTKYNEVDVDMSILTSDGDHWERHYDEDVIAWCLIENIEPFKF